MKTINELRLGLIENLKGIDLIPLPVELPQLKLIKIAAPVLGAPHDIKINEFIDAITRANISIEVFGLYCIVIDSIAKQSLIKLKSINTLTPILESLWALLTLLMLSSK